MITSPLLARTSSERDRATQIGVARMVVGSLLLDPTPISARVFGLPADLDNEGLRLLGRLAGIRNVTLGAWTVLVRDADLEQRRLCYRLNACVDAADLVVIAWALVRHPRLRRAAATSSILATSALLAWLDLLREAA